MPINLNLQPQANIGKIAHRWSFREFNPRERSTAWWVVAGIIGAAIVTYAIVTANFLFALIVLMVAIIFVTESRRQPKRLDCLITGSGAAVGKKFWRWSELDSFWIAYRPPEITNLYLVPKNPLDPRVRIPLERMNPLTVRQHLTQYLTEDLSREDEPTSEALSRLLKLQ